MIGFVFSGKKSFVDQLTVEEDKDHWLVQREYDEDKERFVELMERDDEVDLLLEDNNVIKQVLNLLNLLLEMMKENLDLLVLSEMEEFHFQILILNFEKEKKIHSGKKLSVEIFTFRWS